MTSHTGEEPQEPANSILDIRERSAGRQEKALRSEVWRGFLYALLVHVIAVAVVCGAYSLIAVVAPKFSAGNWLPKSIGIPLVLASLWLGGSQVIYVVPVYRRLVRLGTTTHFRKGFVLNCIVLFFLSSACMGWASFVIYQLSGS